MAESCQRSKLKTWGLLAAVMILVCFPGVSPSAVLAQPSPPPLPPGQGSSAEVRDEVSRIMDREEFRYDKSLWDRFTEWLSEKLGEHDPGAPPVGAGSFGGGVGALVAWLLIVVAVAAMVAAIAYVVMKRIPKASGDDEADVETAIEHVRRASEWRSEAEQLESQGEWKLAIRSRYRMLVRTLMDRGQLPDVPGRTTGELRADLAGSTPSASDMFDTATLLFELPWYADVDTGQEHNERFRSLAEEVLRAPVEQPLDHLGMPGGPGDHAGKVLL